MLIVVVLCYFHDIHLKSIHSTKITHDKSEYIKFVMKADLTVKMYQNYPQEVVEM